MKIKWKSNFKVKTVDNPQKIQLWLMTTFLLQAARILVGFLVGLGVGRDAGLEKCHYLQWEERKTYSDGKIQRPLLRTQDPFSPSSFSCLFLYLAHPSSSLPPSPLLILKPSYRPGLCWAKEVVKPGDLFCWCLLVTWTWSVCHLCTPPLLPHPSLASADSTWVFWTCTQLYPRPPCSLPSSWNKFCYISSRLLSTFSCHIGFLLWWRAWVSQCPSQTLMFRREVA